MKQQEIQVGRIYHDGKAGLREVVAIEAPVGVRYRLLAAKVEQEFDRHGVAKSVLGVESAVTLAAFAAWAKEGYDAQEGDKVLLRMRAAKIKLSPGEIAFMESVKKEMQDGPCTAGMLASYDHTEGRAVAGLEKKGLVRRFGGGEVELLALGAARINAIADSPLPQSQTYPRSMMRGDFN